MSAQQLTREQDRCLALDRNLLVVAGAGSGKTRVLMHRYIAMLEQPGVGLQNILALTFSNKAAAEMLERVQRRIRELRAERPAEAARWSELAEEIGRAQVSTIHSFCESLLRDFPIEAGVDPDFEILEEVDHQLLIAEAAQRALADIAAEESAPEYQPLSRLLSAYRRAKLTEIVQTLLERRYDVNSFLDRAAQLPPQELRAYLRRSRRAAQEPGAAAALADGELKAALDALLQCRARTSDDSAEKQLGPLRPDIARFLHARAAAEAIEPLFDLAPRFLTERGAPRSSGRMGSKGNWDPDQLDRFRRAFAVAAARLAGVLADAPSRFDDADEQSIACLQDLSMIFRRALAALRQAKGDGRRLDFDDLIHGACSLLLSAPQGLRDGLRRRFRYVMVDEFQDTDPAQWEIVRLLLGGGAQEGDLPSDRLCLLADPKQSIYGFRGADVRVVNRAGRELAPGQGGQSVEQPLSDNFRSLQVLVDFQNFFFSRLMSSPRREWEVAYLPMGCMRLPPGHPSGRIELLHAAPAEGEHFASTAEAVAAEAELIARKVAQITSDSRRTVWAAHDFEGGKLEQYVPLQPGHIAMLFRRRTYLKAYEHALRRRGVPYVVHAGIGFFQRQEVLDLFNLLRFLANERDDIALAGALRSPLFGLSDEGLFRLCRDSEGTLYERLRAAGLAGLASDDAEALRRAQRLLERWRGIADRFSSVELLRTVLDDTAFAGSQGGGIAGEQRRANLDKLLDIIRSYEQRSPAQGVGLHGLADRLERLTSSHEREGLAQLEMEKGNSVKIMTVHAAKGLEFPVVFLPDMAGGVNRKRRKAVEVDRELGVGLLDIPLGGDLTQRADTGLAKAIRKGQELTSEAEEKRLLYVAVTRARDELHLVGRDAPRGSPGLWWKWLNEQLVSQEDSAFGFSSADGRREYCILVAARPDEIEVPPREAEPPPLFLSLVPPQGRGAADAASVAQARESLRRRLQFVQEDRLYPEFPATALNLYARCPAAFYLRYVAGLGEDLLQALEPVPPHGGAAGRAMWLGTLTHAAIEQLIRRPELADGDLRKELRLVRSDEGEFPDDPLLDEVLAKHVAGFRRSPVLREARAADPIYTELPFLLRLGAGVVAGQVDLVYRIAAGWRIVDYKTSRVDESRPASELAEEYRLQLACYAVAAARLFDGARQGLQAALYLTRSGELVGEEYAAEGLARAQEELTEILRKIVSAAPQDFAPERRTACGSCAYCRWRLCRPGEALQLDARRRSTVRELI